MGATKVVTCPLENAACTFLSQQKNIESCDGDFSVSEMTLLVDHPLDEIGRPQRSVDQANYIGASPRWWEWESEEEEEAKPNSEGEKETPFSQPPNRKPPLPPPPSPPLESLLRSRRRKPPTPSSSFPSVLLFPPTLSFPSFSFLFAYI